MMITRFLESGMLLLVVVLSSSRVAWSHPGHESLPLAPHSALHYLAEPAHALPTFAVGCGLAWAALGIRRRILARRPSPR
ncbi:MAG: hypothetical protein ACK53L_16300 [Pirellulaceae bacterium]|jgi:hypothetical protein